MGCSEIRKPTVNELLLENDAPNNKSTGHWTAIRVQTDSVGWTVECSNCHFLGFIGRTPYCPMCGAKMENG